MKFSQFIEYNMKNIFLEISCRKFDEGTSPRPFYKKLKWNISLGQQPKVDTV